MGDYPIPEPGKLDLTTPLNQISYTEAVSEQGQMGAPWSPKWREKYDWGMRFALRPVLFLIIVALSWWWSVNVSKLVWASGKGWVKLDKTVLVVLGLLQWGTLLLLSSLLQDICSQRFHQRSSPGFSLTHNQLLG